MKTIHTVAAALALCGLASAQGFDDRWVEFTPSANQFDPQTVSDTDTEVDFYTGDLDQDGFEDLVVVRKQPFTSSGKRTNLLLMNEGGAFTDRTADFAASSDVAGDQGFLTPTNDRDVVVVDLDNDGWLDVVTATTLSDGDPKHIGHPRIYMNLGTDGAGNWLGLEHQDARVPQLFHFGNGQPHNPRFCSVAAGDVTGDGFADLYFGDYDSGPSSSSSNDLNDRLFVNDGNGFFTDQSQSRMSAQALLSAFGTEVEIEDFNGDGAKDIAKDTALNAPQYVAISYNDAGNAGQFPSNFFDDFHTGFAPYHIDAGDLNADGRIDLVFSDDVNDRFRINEGNDVFGRVQWSPAQTFDFLTGGDDGFASNNLIADLDGDGWNDVLITDVDVDIGGYGRRMHVYHNLTPEVGSETFLEERQQAGGNGWIGVVGMRDGDLRGSHDVVVFDIDNDGDNDLVLGRSVGTFVWENTADPVLCQTDLGVGQSGSMAMEVCGQPLWFNNQASLDVTGGPSAGVGAIVAGLGQSPLPILGGTLIPTPNLELPLALDAAGGATLPLTAGPTAATLFLQTIALDPSTFGFDFSNAIEVVFNQG